MHTTKNTIKRVNKRYKLIPMSQKRDVKIIVTCPDCGREGKLVVSAVTKFGKRKYRIVHSHGEKCPIGVCHPHWEEIDDIYEEVRVLYKNEIKAILKKMPQIPQSLDSTTLLNLLSK